MLTPVFENGVLHRLGSSPVVPLIEEPAHASQDPLAPVIDYEFLEYARALVRAAEQVPALEEVQRMLSKDKSSWAEIIATQRQDRL